jgi:hypothetical protein
MIEIIGALTGFAGSLLPNIFKFVQDKSDKKHELEIIKLQIQANKQEHIARLEEINTSADINEIKITHEIPSSGIKWIDALNGTVRPIIAYAFFILYFWTKIAYMTNTEYFKLSELWTSIDNTIFLTIIAFFYGQRAMQKVMR